MIGGAAGLEAMLTPEG